MIPRCLGACLKTKACLASAMLLLVAATPFPRTAAATDTPSEPATPDATPRTLDERLTEARTLVALTAHFSLTNSPAGISNQDLARHRALAERLVRLYEQQISNAAELNSTRTRRQSLAREAQSWTHFPDPPPYSILLVDRLREELHSNQLKINSAQNNSQTLNSLIEDHRTSLAQAEETIRQLNEKLEATADSATTTRLEWLRDLEQLRSQVASATIAVLDSERSLRQEELAEAHLRVGLLQRQLVFAQAGAHFTQADFEQVTARLDRERILLESDLADALSRRTNALRTLQSAPNNPTPGSPESAAAWTAAREAQLESADTAIRCFRHMLEGNSVERTLWELRFSGYDTDSVSTLAEADRRLRSLTQRLHLWRDQLRQYLEVSSSQVQLLYTQLNTLPSDSDLRPPTLEHLESLRERDRTLLRLDRTFDRIQRLTQRIEESLRAAEIKLPLSGRLQHLFSNTSSFLQRLWNLELFTAEDTITVDGQKITGKRSVTLGKITLAFLILVLGIWITGIISRFAEPIIIRRLHIERNQAALIRRWLRAALIAGLVIFSLTSVKIPLTIFAFAGGALAIGLGFGTQTVLKNFVSGLILLFERPFRVGDVLDVAGQKGTVTNIGLRASVLQLWDGTETLIPNSSLLENNVTNWTYSNCKVRFSVTVGVAYGSDPRRVIQLLDQVAERHGLVLPDPKPLVLFTDFGESTLNFELRFWVDVAKTNSAQVGSDLRLMIASTFAEHGINIAFPQRDFHLHATKPLQIEILPPTGHPPGTQ